MKERGILFSDDMVRAILDDRKTQTRRIAKLPPWTAWASVDPGGTIFGPGPYLKAHRGEPVPDDVGAMERVHCPYGTVGDRLWVRETFQFFYAPGSGGAFPATCMKDANAIRYRATPDRVVAYPTSVKAWEDTPNPKSEHGWRPSIFMPRWASRITVEIAEVRVQRLGDISEEDAKAEGLGVITKDGRLWKYGIPDRDGLPGTDDDGWPWHEWDKDPRVAYLRLWDKINGAGAAAANPWVWAITFKRVDAAKAAA
jgi:hypothetical protein